MDEKHKQKRQKKRGARKITPDYLHNAGLYYLGRFSASSAGFRNVMLRKVRRSCLHHKEQDMQACLQMVDELVLKFERAGLLNDKVYAESLAASLRRQGRAGKTILIKMQEKGLERETARNALLQTDAAGGKDAELRAAIYYARKRKVGPFRIRENKLQNELASLARAGFSYDLSRKVLEMKSEDAMALLNP